MGIKGKLCILILNLFLMTKKDLIDQIHMKTGMEKAEVGAIVESFCIAVKKSMAEGHNIYIRGFGTFEVKKRALQIACTITQKTSLALQEHYIPFFKPTIEFAETVKRRPKPEQT